jgi:hypothetical protein
MATDADADTPTFSPGALHVGATSGMIGVARPERSEPVKKSRIGANMIVKC